MFQVLDSPANPTLTGTMYVKKSPSTWWERTTTTVSAPDGGPGRQLAESRESTAQSENRRRRTKEEPERPPNPSADSVHGPSQGWSSHRRDGFCVAHLSGRFSESPGHEPSDPGMGRKGEEEETFRIDLPDAGSQTE